MAPSGISVTTSIVSRSLGKMPKVSRGFMGGSPRFGRGRQDSPRLCRQQEMRTCRIIAPAAGMTASGTIPRYGPPVRPIGGPAGPRHRMCLQSEETLMLDLGLGGKVAIITGGSEGLGRAAARRLAAEGARVAICARRPDVLERAAAGIRAAGGEGVGRAGGGPQGGQNE